MTEEKKDFQKPLILQQGLLKPFSETVQQIKDKFAELYGEEIHSLDDLIRGELIITLLNSGGYERNREQDEDEQISLEDNNCKYKCIDSGYKTATGESICFFFTKRQQWRIQDGLNENWLYVDCNTPDGFKKKQINTFQESMLKLDADSAFYKTLADTAFPEKWSEGKGANNYSLLENYIQFTLRRLKDEEKIYNSEDTSKIVFNTGLFNHLFAPIIVTATRTKNCLKKPEIFNANTSSFKKERYVIPEKHRVAGKKFVTNFEDIPFANYFVTKDNPNPSPIEKARCCIFNPDLEVDTDGTYFFEHISDKEHLNRININPALKTNSEALLEKIKQAVEKAKTIAKQNYKLVIPQWDFKGGTNGELQFLIPIYLDNFVGAPNCSLVVALEEDANGQPYYLGKTILDLKQSYRKARLISKPDNAWLTPENL